MPSFVLLAALISIVTPTLTIDKKRKKEWSPTSKAELKDAVKTCIVLSSDTEDSSDPEIASTGNKNTPMRELPY